MTVPVPVTPESTLADHDECGTLAGDAWIQALVPGAPGLPTLDNSTSDDVASAINALAIPRLTAQSIRPGPPDILSLIPQPDGIGLMVPEQVNGDTTLNPNGPVAHWTDPYSGGSLIGWFNCWPQDNPYWTSDPTLYAQSYRPDIGIVVIRLKPEPKPPIIMEDIVNASTVAPWFWQEKNEQHCFQVHAGTLYHKWGNWTQNNEVISLGTHTVAGDSGVVAAHWSGQLHALFVLDDGNVGHAYQGDTEGVWHFERLA